MLFSLTFKPFQNMKTIETTMTSAVTDSLDALRTSIRNVRYAPYVAGQTCEVIQFDRRGKPEFARLAGRNRNLMLSGGDCEADKALAVRCILDGDSWPA